MTSVPVTVRACVALPQGVSGIRTRLVSFHGLPDGKEHVALVFGELARAPLVRIHSECLTGDVFGSLRCDCGPQLQEAHELLGAEGGILMYLRQEGRGIGLYNKIDAYALQEKGFDTFEANVELGREPDERSYDVAAAMLLALEVKACRLLTNNPLKTLGLVERGITVLETIRTGYYRQMANAEYLDAKEIYAGHDFERGIHIQALRRAL